MINNMKLLSFFLSFIFTIGGGGLALANDLTIGQDEMATIFRTVVTKDAPWPQQDLAIKNFSAIPEQVALPLGKLGYQVLSQDHGRLLGQRTISVLLTIADKPQVKIKMHGDLHLYGDVLVARHRLRRHTIISANDLAVTRKDITMFAHDLVQDKAEVEGQRVTTTLREGAIIFARNLQQTPLIKRGDLVTIQARNDKMRISVQGEARTQGTVGQGIKVKNLMSRRIITARVVKSGLVSVDF